MYGFVTILIRYHEWMGNPELRAQTASERLTLEEEYQMQRDWMNQDDSMSQLYIQHSHAVMHPSQYVQTEPENLTQVTISTGYTVYIVT